MSDDDDNVVPIRREPPRPYRNDLSVSVADLSRLRAQIHSAELSHNDTIYELINLILRLLSYIDSDPEDIELYNAQLGHDLGVLSVRKRSLCVAKYLMNALPQDRARYEQTRVYARAAVYLYENDIEPEDVVATIKEMGGVYALPNRFQHNASQIPDTPISETELPQGPPAAPKRRSSGSGNRTAGNSHETNRPRIDLRKHIVIEGGDYHDRILDVDVGETVQIVARRKAYDGDWIDLEVISVAP